MTNDPYGTFVIDRGSNDGIKLYDPVVTSEGLVGVIVEVANSYACLLYTSYDKGWTAYVNGKPADIEKVSYGFMAVKADAGENTIEFRYETPGLKIGIVISIIGLICLGAYIVVFRKKKNNESGFSHCYEMCIRDSYNRYL